MYVQIYLVTAQGPCQTFGSLDQELFRGSVQGTGHIIYNSISQLTLHSQQTTTVTHLALTIRPKIHPNRHDVIYRRIGPLIQQRGAQRAERVHAQPGLDAAVDGALVFVAGEEAQRPLVGDAEEAEDEVDGLEDGDRLDSAVEVLC